MWAIYALAAFGALVLLVVLGGIGWILTEPED